MTGGVLQELARQVRRDTLMILAAARPEWLTWAPTGTSNHILWHAGHALWLLDALGVELLTGRSELPAGWAETFGMNCRSVHLTKDWPSRSTITGLLQRQLVRILELLDQATTEQLERPAGTGPAWARIMHGLHDEAKHSGEMYLLLKICRSSSVPKD